MVLNAKSYENHLIIVLTKKRGDNKGRKDRVTRPDMSSSLCSSVYSTCRTDACVSSEIDSSYSRATTSSRVSANRAAKLRAASCYLEQCDRFYDSSSEFVIGFGSRNIQLRRRGRAKLHCTTTSRSGKIMAIAVQPEMDVSLEKKLPTKQRRVVVTGMGVETPLGSDPDAFYNNLLNGVSGISEIEAFDCSQYPTRIAGEIKSFSTDGYVAPKLSKRMDRFMLYMLTAGKKALVDAGITEDVMDELNKKRCGVLIGSAMGGMKVFQDAIEALRISYRKMNPFCVPFATTNMGSAILAMDLLE